MFWDMAPPPKTFENNVIFPKVESTTWNTIKLFSDLGIDVIVDFVHIGMSSLMEYFVNLRYECLVLYVNVSCPLEELCRREKERGDRQIGLAESQLSQLNPQDTYDIVVDTFNSTTEECADRIIEMLNYPEKFTAFKTLWI